MGLRALLWRSAFVTGALAIESTLEIEGCLAQDDTAQGDDVDSEERDLLSLRQLRAQALSAEGRAQGDPGDDSLQPASSPKGSCTALDEGIMAKFGGGNADGSFPKLIANCGHDAYSWFSFHRNDMQRCIQRKTGLSEDCATCFADAGQFGYRSCKLQCLFGSWCSNSCLSCTSRINADTRHCAGVQVPEVKMC